MPVCSKVEPPLIQVRQDHWVACHLFPTPMAGSADASVGNESSPLPAGSPGVSMPAAAS